MGMQLKYVFPFIIATVSYTTSGAIALYFITTNIMGSFQELYVRKTILKEDTQSA
jgi:membrane protein insertase Oxa1/YidC/SpoIIIJ